MTLVSIQPIDHAGQDNDDCRCGNTEWRAAGAHIAAAKLPRRQAARAVEHERREVGENRQPLERAGDGEREHDCALQEDRDDRRAMDGMQAGERRGQEPVAREREQHARRGQDHRARVAEHGDHGADEEQGPRPSAERHASRVGERRAFEVASAGPSTPCATNCKPA